ncbi:hypothetical protein HanRHA438_Chr10g0459561 [Helianthus annuus]|nr:hypothetical protein HanRHA438_Chr10g0459561 [Helianthus annuus]
MYQILHPNFIQSRIRFSRVTLPLIPQHRFNLSTTTHRSSRSPDHIFIQLLPFIPFLNSSPTNRTRHQIYNSNNVVFHCVCERHPRAHTAGLGCVDVGVEWLLGGFPDQACV